MKKIHNQFVVYCNNTTAMSVNVSLNPEVYTLLIYHYGGEL